MHNTMTESEVTSRLRRFMQDNNGENSWREYNGSQLEADIVSFVRKEVHDCCGRDIGEGRMQCVHEFIADDKSDIPFDLICQICGKTA